MKIKKSVGSVSTAPPDPHTTTVDRLISSILLHHSQDENNIFTAAIAMQWFEMIDRTDPKKIPELLSKLVKSLLMDCELVNKEFCKLREQETAIKVIVHEDNKFLSDLKLN